MDSYDEYYKCICRVCLNYSNKENMVRLVGMNSENGLSYYGKAVEKFANVSIKVNDGLPKSMCLNCLSMLKQAIHFKFKCESSDKNLSILYRQHVDSGCKLEEIVVDFSLFKQNFPQYFNESPQLTNGENVSSIVCAKNNKTCDVNSDESSRENDNNMNDIQRETDYSSADEMLDLLEKNVLHFSDIPSNIHKKEVELKEVKRKPLPRQIKQKRCKKVSKNEKFVCKVCQKELANPGTLKYHMQSHNGFKFICEHCGKGFPVHAYLETHLKTRHGIGACLQCPHCTFKAPKKFLLTEHIRLHTGERPYTCDKCGLTFRRIALWRTHMVHHGEKTVQCPHCPKKFYKVEHMKEHSNNIHERMYMYLCHICNATYAMPRTVRRHLTEKHGIPREMQGKIIRLNKGSSPGFPEK